MAALIVIFGVLAMLVGLLVLVAVQSSDGAKAAPGKHAGDDWDFPWCDSWYGTGTLLDVSAISHDDD